MYTCVCVIEGACMYVYMTVRNAYVWGGRARLEDCMGVRDCGCMCIAGWTWQDDVIMTSLFI